MLFLPPRLTLSHKVPHKHTLAWFILIFPPSGFTLRAEQCLLVPSWSPQQDRAISNRYCCTSEPGLFICTSPLFLTVISENKDILSLTEIHNISQLELFNQVQYSYQQIKQARKQEQVQKQCWEPEALQGKRTERGITKGPPLTREGKNKTKMHSREGAGWWQEKRKDEEAVYQRNDSVLNAMVLTVR